MQEVKFFSLSKYGNKSKYEKLLKNNSNFNNNSIKNVEIKKETHELRPNSEIKTELATTMPTHNFIENSLIILTKQTLDIFLRQENPSELIALYTFYYYTAKWQQTNQIKCTSSYVAKGLHWCRNKVIKVKKQLLEMGLIQDVRWIDAKTKKIIGYYVKMNYVFKKSTLEKIEQEKSQCAHFEYTGNDAHSELETQYLQQKNQCTQIQTLDFEYTNALSDKYKNALSTVNLSKKVSKQLEQNKISPENEKNNSNSISKKQTKAKKAQSKPISFDEIIDAYTENEDLRKELKEHLKTRKQKKAALNNRAIELSLKKLDKLADSDEEKLLIVQNSIMNGWVGFFPLKQDEKKQLRDKSSYDLDEYMKTMDTFGTEPKGEPKRFPFELGNWL